MDNSWTITTLKVLGLLLDLNFTCFGVRFTDYLRRYNNDSQTILQWLSYRSCWNPAKISGRWCIRVSIAWLGRMSRQVFGLSSVPCRSVLVFCGFRLVCLPCVHSGTPHRKLKMKTTEYSRFQYHYLYIWWRVLSRYSALTLRLTKLKLCFTQNFPSY